MATFTVTIECDNAAFDQEMEIGGPAAEISRILNNLSKHISKNPDGMDYGTFRDANGNTVGHYEYVEE
jgi:hypothetical protein